jgi:MerR family transcriptional regulator/heat shock protein HspR
MISAVAESYGVHPQTLRLYEREGLLKPSRTEGNTRLYTDADIERLELILSLTRDMGVNLAGVQVVLNMRARMEQMHREMKQFVEMVQHEVVHQAPRNPFPKNALVRVIPTIRPPVKKVIPMASRQQPSDNDARNEKKKK